MTITHRIVTDDEGDMRLDRYLRRHFPALTQGAIQKLLRTGQVRVDGKRVGASSRLMPSQTVRIPPMAEAARPPPRAPVTDEATRRDLEAMVLYRDDWLIVLNKTAGLPVQGGPGIVRHLDALLDGLRHDASDRPRLVHRLDKDTSGVLLLARTPGVAAKLAAAFRGRDVEKTYWALVAGRPSQNEGRIDIPLIRTMAGRGERVVTAKRGDPGAAFAITDFRVLDAAGKAASWLELLPLTGRTHQLRVHCAALGTPIVGDAMYGDELGYMDGFAYRLHLHARRLRFPHPAGGFVDIEADLPGHMGESFARLGFEFSAAAPPKRDPGEKI
jgi:23S rRNA pseudouridine955/2504/2580 synthase